MGEVVRFPGGTSPGDGFLAELEMTVLRTLVTSPEDSIDEMMDRARGLCVARELYLRVHDLPGDRDAQTYLATLWGRLSTLSRRERAMLRHPACDHRRMSRVLNGDR